MTQEIHKLVNLLMDKNENECPLIITNRYIRLSFLVITFLVISQRDLAAPLAVVRLYPLITTVHYRALFMFMRINHCSVYHRFSNHY